MLSSTITSLCFNYLLIHCIDMCYAMVVTQPLHCLRHPLFSMQCCIPFQIYIHTSIHTSIHNFLLMNSNNRSYTLKYYCASQGRDIVSNLLFGFTFGGHFGYIKMPYLAQGWHLMSALFSSVIFHLIKTETKKISQFFRRMITFWMQMLTVDFWRPF